MQKAQESGALGFDWFSSASFESLKETPLNDVKENILQLLPVSR
jgi:hypothetical protein